MSSCCEDKSCAIEALRKRQSGTLKIVLIINAVMFFVVFLAGIFAASVSLLSDSLDNLGDAITYGLSLYAVSLGNTAKAKVAFFKGCLIFLAAIFVISQVIYHLLNPSLPIFEVMGLIGVLALIANSVCLFLLWKHRNEDINMSSVWECSRNDIFVNLSVLLAAAGVYLANANWPDIVIGTLLALLLLNSSRKVLVNSWHQIRSS